jgi:pyruvyl transferase EpsO
LLLRDQASLDRAAGLGAKVTALCPDLALGLAPRPRPRPPVVDIVWCPQHATESSFDPPDVPDVEVLDWLGRFPDERPRPVAARLGGLGASATARAPRLSARAPGLVAWSYRAAGEHYVERAMRALARGRVVVTERLHGHLFCLLLGLPHVLLDSLNGKVRALAGTWTATSDLVHVADDVEGALELARRLVREAGSAP